MINDIDISTQISNLKNRSLKNLNLLVFFVMLTVAIVATFFPELIPKDELSPRNLTQVTLISAILLFFATLAAAYKKSKLSSFLFFGTVYAGVLTAVFLNPRAYVFQNAIILLLTSNLMATNLLDKKDLIVNLILSILVIDLPLLALNIKVSEILLAFIFFHIFSLSCYWVEHLKSSIEHKLINDAKRDSKLKEIGYIAGSIVHEINNPLAILMGSQRRLKKSFSLDKDLNEQKERILQCVELNDNGIQKIDDIVKSMYGLIKTEHNIRPTIITQEDLVKELRPYVEEFQNRFQVPIHIDSNIKNKVYALANISEVVQVINNLVKNACAYTSTLQGAEVWINFLLEKDHLVIYVQDLGQGPPEKIAQKLGKAFNSGSSDGLGLGLSISMALANKNKGKLEYLKDLEKTTFSLGLPLFHISSAIPVEEVEKVALSKFATLLLLKNDVLVIVMDKGKYKFGLSYLKEMLKEQLELINYKVPYPYIVLTGDSEMSLQALLYFNSAEMKDRFISGAIVGNSRSTNFATNTFSKFFNLPYPVRSFNNFNDAHEWTKAKLKPSLQTVKPSNF